MAGKAKFTFRTRDDFEFRNAPIYRKTAILKKSQVKIATKRQDVVTKVNGLEETRNVARAGDYIVTGPQGERYVMSAAKFKALYEIDPAKPSRFRSKARVRALTLTENTAMQAPWGEEQRALKGGVVVQRVGKPKDVYLIDRRSFAATYEPANRAPARKPH